MLSACLVKRQRKVKKKRKGKEGGEDDGVRLAVRRGHKIVLNLDLRSSIRGRRIGEVDFRGLAVLRIQEMEWMPPTDIR